MENQTSLLAAIETFCRPYYRTRDIMHDWTHIDRVRRSLNKLVAQEGVKIDTFVVEAALAFHGIIYMDEIGIRQYLAELGIAQEKIDKIIQVAWESQKEERPVTIEGLILHDAHLLEGGEYFEIIKSLITGSVRGQSLKETLHYIEEHLLHKGECYTEQGQKSYEKMKATTHAIYESLKQELYAQ